MKKILLSILLLTGATLQAQTTHMVNWFMGITNGQASRTIDVGDTVMWMWTDAGMPHTVTSLAGAHESFNSGTLTGAGQNFSHTFTTAGVSGYRCLIHPSMQGTITVNALSADSFKEDKPTAWPNPVNDVLTISGVSGETHIKVVDASGRTVLNNSAQTPEIKIYMENYPSGVYFISAESDGRQQQFRIVKN